MWIAVGHTGFPQVFPSHIIATLVKCYYYNILLYYLFVYIIAPHINTNNSVCVNILHRQKENVHYSITPIDAVVFGFPGGSNKSLYNTI